MNKQSKVKQLFDAAAENEQALQLRAQARRLSNRIEVLERRNLALRDEVERMTHGELAPWTPFQKADCAYFGDGTRMTDPAHEVFLNSRYQVTVFGATDPQLAFAPKATMVWLSIKRQDGAAVCDWREFQRIKNELCGPESEGVMLYPAESRCVDGANQYHMHILVNGKWPFGFTSRLVSEDNNDGVQQRPWPEDQRPKDLTSVSVDQMRAVYEGK